MLLTYVDESFSRDYFFMAAVLATPEQVRDLTQALDAVVQSLASTHPDIDVRHELHGHEIFQGIGPWGTLFPRQRVDVFVSTFRAIRDVGATIMFRGLDLKAQRFKYADPFPAYSIVMTHIMKSVQKHVASRDELALLICDEPRGRPTSPAVG